MKVVVEFSASIGTVDFEVTHEDEAWVVPVPSAFDPNLIEVAPGAFVAREHIVVIRFHPENA